MARYNPFGERERRNPYKRQEQAPRRQPSAWLVNAPTDGLRINEKNPREFREQQRQGAVAPSSASSSAIKARPPIASLLQFFTKNARTPNFQKVPQQKWFYEARTAGIKFTKKDFNSAWRFAVESGVLESLKGAPKKSKQAKRQHSGKKGNNKGDYILDNG